MVGVERECQFSLAQHDGFAYAAVSSASESSSSG